MGKIQILDDLLANQIAAGEVVERPSSIVKELVENAIDAEASRIRIYIEEGGISLIRVSDNGVGMEREDARLAFSRHATSKIKRERDLYSIRTLGFRGEALPSIASVSRVSLTTADNPSGLGVKVQIEGGNFVSMDDVSCSPGTEVIVRDLFYNTPARLKYLKTVNTEISHVADAIGRLALAHPNIAFSLSHNQRELFRTPGDGKLIHVLHALYGKQVASKLVSISGENPDFRISGCMSKPEVTRSSRSYITIILNGRNVRSIPITQSVLRAYGTLLPTGRYPIGVLHVEMDPKLVDVNVHPAKLEVRLSKERECCQLVEHTIKKAFQEQRFVPEVSRVPGEAKMQKTKVVQESLHWEPPASKHSGYSAPKDGSSRVKEMAETPTRTNQAIPPAEPSRLQRDIGGLNIDQDEAIFSPTVSSISQIKKDWRSAPGLLPPEEIPGSSEEEKGEKKKRLPEMMPLSQIHGTYIVAQSADGFYLLDQHAAHERIYYELFSKKMNEENHRQQPLLIPMTIECSPAEAEVVQAYIDYLKQWGLEIEPFGGSTFLVRSYPSWFPQEDAESIIREIVEWLKEQGKVETARLRDAGAKMMSCKAAIKANRHLRQDEMEHLLQQLNECHNPFTCPHGRPIFIHFSTYELEKMFKRVM
ncbi:DNA mismatch repair endonuclease MutL [Paenactinomyces guangxiensis]|uniref:DNA mismatch repair protein MutL n=1 Tax=Paenactinomyces guangxiensis TaxID=1490290 RepID=A0A7W1WQX6_9BACL|nr:DNA mismatch repair endonuclease MutL [Paenactinomyces guangxiensis]MBA4494440.1 DNA mismatch repair endonuclease MutL [Paenactinomyces guangxiensis]MBH8591505.1 DNA mismatch repair endonuclease MutL [Paenactinomyces guangxiensis]